MSQCYLQLTLPDRRRVHQLLERKVPIAEIARQLGRHPFVLDPTNLAKTLSWQKGDSEHPRGRPF